MHKLSTLLFLFLLLTKVVGQNNNKLVTSPTWDLSTLYANKNAWERDYLLVKSTLPFLNLYKNKIGTTANDLHEYMQLVMIIDARQTKLATYSFALIQTHNNSDSCIEMHQRYQELEAQINSSLSYFQQEIASLSDSTLTLFYTQKPALKEYTFYLDKIRHNGLHHYIWQKEKIITLIPPITNAQQQIYSAFLNSDIVLQNAQEKKPLIQHLKTHKYFIASLITAAISTNIFYARVRGFTTTLQAKFFAEKIPEESAKTLIQETSNQVQYLQEWVQLKAKKYALDSGITIQHIHKDTTTYKWQFSEAQQAILASCQPLGKTYSEVVNQAFTQRWIDVYKSPTKNQGNTTLALNTHHPYILLNWGYQYADLLILAGEIGKATNNYISNQNQPSQYSLPSVSTTYVASYVSRFLLYEYLIKTAKGAQKKAYIESMLLEFMRFYNLVLNTEMEMNLYNYAEQGHIITEEYLVAESEAIFKKYYGEKLLITDYVQYHWIDPSKIINHVYINLDMTMQMAIAYTFYDAILREGEPAIQRYMNFLKEGNSNYASTIFAKYDIDINSPNLYTPLFDRINSLLSMYKQEQ